MHVPNKELEPMRLNLFTPGKRVTVIGAISIKRVVALMTMDNSMDGKAFEVFIEQCLVSQLWSGAVVVMDNLPAHKVDSITSMIESVGIGDKLRLKARCQGNFRWWLKEQGLPSADGLGKGSDNQLNLGFSLSFDNR